MTLGQETRKVYSTMLPSQHRVDQTGIKRPIFKKILNVRAYLSKPRDDNMHYYAIQITTSQFLDKPCDAFRKRHTEL